MILQQMYLDFLSQTGKKNTYNLAYAWLGRQETVMIHSEADRRGIAKQLAGE